MNNSDLEKYRDNNKLIESLDERYYQKNIDLEFMNRIFHEYNRETDLHLITTIAREIKDIEQQLKVLHNNQYNLLNY
jgi:RNA polymerase-binding transcription factor DksA